MKQTKIFHIYVQHDLASASRHGCVHFCTLFHLIIGMQRTFQATGASSIARRVSHARPVGRCDTGGTESHYKLRTMDWRGLLVASIMEHRKVKRSISDYAKKLKSCSLCLYVCRVFLFLLLSNIPQGKKKKSPRLSACLFRGGKIWRCRSPGYPLPRAEEFCGVLFRSNMHPFLFFFFFLDCILLLFFILNSVT